MTNPFGLGGFELDLGNLEKSSGLIITDRQRTASVVNSQDDGPTDFTFNMGQWMKGTHAHEKNEAQQIQAADIQVEEQPNEQPAPAIDTCNRRFFSHVSGFTDGTDGPICSSYFSPGRLQNANLQALEQLAAASVTSCNTVRKTEPHSPRSFSHISGFSDGPDEPSYLPPVGCQQTDKQALGQPAPADDITYNTISQDEHDSSDSLSHISSFADGSDGPICSSTFSPVRVPKVKEITNESAYTLPAPAYLSASDDILQRNTNSPMPTSRRGSGSSQDAPADDLPCSRRSSDPRAPGSPTPLAKQSGLQRNPLVDAIIASRGITSPNSRAAAIVNGAPSKSSSIPVQSRFQTNSQAKGAPNDTLPSKLRPRGNSEVKEVQRVSQARPRSKSDPKEVQANSQSQARSRLPIKQGQNTTLASQSRSRGNSQTKDTQVAALPSKPRSRGNSNPKDDSILSHWSAPRALLKLQNKETQTAALPTKSHSRGNSNSEDSSITTQSSQSRARSNIQAKDTQIATLPSKSRSRGNSNAQEAPNTTFSSVQPRSRSNSQTKDTRSATLPSQSHSRANSNIEETSHTTLPLQSRGKSQSKEHQPTAKAASAPSQLNTDTKQNNAAKEHQSISKAAPALSRLNTETQQNNDVETHQPTAKEAPTLSRLNTETKQNNAAEEVFDHISSLQAEIERLRLENQELQIANSSLERDNASYHSAYENIERAYEGLEREAEQQIEQHNTAYKALERENSKVQADFEDLQDRYRDREKAFASEMKDLKDHFRNYESTEATKLRSELQAVESNFHEREAALTSEVKTVKSQCKDHIINLQRQHETEIRERDTALSLAKKESTTAKKESHIVNKEVVVMRAQLVDLNEELADTRAIQAQMEAHFQTTMKAREASWQERMDVLMKERGTMSKALMTEWGRREMGESKGKNGGQAYRYRYVKAAAR